MPGESLTFNELRILLEIQYHTSFGMIVLRLVLALCSIV